MSCCCNRVLNLCKVPVCGTLEINQATESGADGLYSLLLDFLETSVLITGEQTSGENIIFDISNLNESYEYTGQIFNSAGEVVSVIDNGVEYNCIKFRTTMRIAAQPSEDDTDIPPVLNIPETVVIEATVDGSSYVTGTTEIVQGIVDSSNTITCAAFEGVRVIVIRGNIPIPGIDPLDGSNYFTKLLANDFIWFNNPLVHGEFIRIQTIPQ